LVQGYCDQVTNCHIPVETEERKSRHIIGWQIKSFEWVKFIGYLVNGRVGF
jgi:hypothetical protein